MAAILIEPSKTALKLGLLRLAQRNLSLFETVPKLRYQSKTLWRRQPDDLIPGKQFHALRVSKNAH